MKSRLIVPEVVQTSNMDCGPAALKCLLEGFGISANYGRLREACQTDVDGTSIDTMEQIAVQLGLSAEQIVVPADHVLLESAGCLPAIAVVVLPNGLTHFVVAWRRHGKWVQIMDPASGRRFVTGAAFLRELYVHQMTVPAADWRDYAGSEQFLKPLREHLRKLAGSDLAAIQELVEVAVRDPGWHSIATLDAALRTLGSLVASSGIEPGAKAIQILQTFIDNPENIPEHYWFVRGAPADPDGAERLSMRGAVLVRALAKTAATATSPELLAALEQETMRPGRELIRLLRADGVLSPAALVIALALASAGVLLEAVLLRGLLSVTVPSQRIGALLALVIFSFALLLLEWPLGTGLLRLGRRLEIRLRLAFLRKIPLLGDRYFQSRLKSDMAERSHSIHQIRHLPELGGRLLRAGFELVLTTAGIIWLDPGSALIVLMSALAALAIPIVAQPVLIERDLRLRTHTGALSHFYLDALLGLFAIHSHGAQPAVRRQHESLLVQWARAGLNLQRLVIALESVQFIAGFGLAIWLLTSHLGRYAESGAVLLLVYWALNLPALGQEIAQIAWQYPLYRNVTLRLLEPLGALEQGPRTTSSSAPPGLARQPAVAITFDNVRVVAAGHTILQSIDVQIRPGEHVAIVGHSGAGKSSLVGMLLGWYRPAGGEVLVDGEPLDEARVEMLRRETAWLDPAVHIWNRSMAENLSYGRTDGARISADDAIEAAQLSTVLERLPEGWETPLGEGGGLVSGGEGQRVRFGRALLRSGVRLAILDEPFRGLDLDQRRVLLRRALEAWRTATLLCITHDVGETLAFDRVLVIERGHIVEDGRPAELAKQAGSRFRSLLDAESFIREELWSDSSWRHLKLERGEVRGA
jgi:ATP-binding cassette subfamily B protein